MMGTLVVIGLNDLSERSILGSWYSIYVKYNFAELFSLEFKSKQNRLDKSSS